MKLTQLFEDAQVVPHGVLYHATPIEYLDSVLRHGIKPSTGGTTFLKRTYEPRVHLTTRIEAAWDFTMSVNARRAAEEHVEYVIVHIDPSKLENAIFYEDPMFSDYGIWTSSAVPPTAIIKTSEVNHDWEPDDDYYDGK